jgi:RNA polymerase sigma-70 factor (ECF subfamily)
MLPHLQASAACDGDRVIEPSDEELMARLRQGEGAALDALYRRYSSKLFAFCRSTTRSSSQQTEDLVHDVFVRVIQAAGRFDARKGTFQTWVFRIARNRCLDVNRRARLLQWLPLNRRAPGESTDGEAALEDVLADGREGAEESPIHDAVIDAVNECIGELENEDERQALVWYYLGGKVYRQIGELLGKSTSMAANRVKSAQEKVRRCLEAKRIGA